MIEAVIAGIALISTASGLNQPVKLAPKAACRLAAAARITSGQAYSIAGTYFADGMHGSMLDVAGCRVGLSPRLEGAALARVSDFHNAFQRRCGTWLHGDYIVGVFTGHLERRWAHLFGMIAPGEVNFFVITDIETKDEDFASITCLGSQSASHP
jgi:hypothetical protein